MLTRRIIQFTLFLSTILLILSMTVLALNASTIVARPQKVFVTPVQIRTSGREQIYKDFVAFFLRSNEMPPAPVVMIPPAPVSGFHEWLTSGNKMATHLSSFMPVVIIYTTLLAVASDALDTNWSHLLPALVVVACTAVNHTSRSGLRVVLVFLRAECTYVVRIALAIAWGLLSSLLSLPLFCVELGLTVSHSLLSCTIFANPMLQVIKYLVRLKGVPLLFRSVNSLVHAQVRYSITPFLTRLLRRNFLLCYISTVAGLLLPRLLVGILTKRCHFRLAGALAFSGTALILLAVRLDPSSECGILARVPSTPQAREAAKEVIQAEKDQEGAPAVEGSPVVISHPSESVPVDLSVFPVRNPFPSAR